MAALFGGSSQRSNKKYLLEFKAGKMYLKGKMCHADKRKGMVYIHQSDDSLMHFCWKDRTSGKVEEDLIVFPDDAEFKRVPQCTTGRVFVLKFRSSTKKIFWLQESKTDKDEEICKKVNDLLNKPPTPGSNRGFGGGALSDLQASDLANLAGESDVSSLLGNMSQEQLLRLFGGLGGLGGSAVRGRPTSSQSQESSTPLRVQSAPDSQLATAEMETTPDTPNPRPYTAATVPQSGGQGIKPAGTPVAAGATGSHNIQLSDLQNVLSNYQGRGAEPEPIDLKEALNAERMVPILADPAVQERLTPYLPQDTSLPSSPDELRATISSPQFHQALNSFSAALASGQLGPVLTQFGLSDEAVAAANQGDVQAFVKAMQDSETKSEEKMEED